jgi:predicted transcriptional regulator
MTAGLQVAIRLSSDQVARIDELVGSVHASRSDLIRRAIDAYLYRLECERDAGRYIKAPLTGRELAFADDADPLATAPEW